MPNILLIETSCAFCSVALSSNGQLLWNKKSEMERQHSKMLGVFVDELVTFSNKQQIPIHAVAVSCGPGSYTGLRIGVSLAKGLCYGLKVPLIAIYTTNILIANLQANYPIDDSALLCPMIDARRMEVYTCLSNKRGENILPISAQIIDNLFLADMLIENKIVFFGDGSSKCKDSILDKNALFIDGVHPFAENMAKLAHESFESQKFEDVIYFEPFYLKDFLLTESKKKFF